MKLLLTTLLLAAWVIAPIGVYADSYLVSISKDNPRVADVVAKMTPLNGEIAMNDEGVHGLEKGWATFVENLSVSTANGEPLIVEQAGLSRWRLVDYEGGPVKLSYRMRLGHDQVQIKFGDNGAAYAMPEGVMWAGRALFIAGQPARDLKLELDVPSQWRVSAPWKRTPGQGIRFVVHSTHDLLNSAFFAGTQTQFSLQAGAVTLRVALAGENTLQLKDDILQSIRRYLQYYAQRFSADQKASMLLIAADRNDWGGEVMGRAISVSVGKALPPGAPPGFKPLSVLAHVIAHEIFHAFSLVRMEVTQDPGFSGWFNEGFGAEYATWLARLRLGEISEDQFLQQMSVEWAKYHLMVDGKRTLRTAGYAKAENYDMVYSGGLIAALALDFQIRHQTNGRRSLEDLWRHVLRRYPRGGDALDFQRLETAARELFGERLVEQLAVFVRVSAEIPFAEAAARVGLKMEQGQLLANPDATENQRRLWREFVAGESLPAEVEQ